MNDWTACVFQVKKVQDGGKKKKNEMGYISQIKIVKESSRVAALRLQTWMFPFMLIFFRLKFKWEKKERKKR